MGGGDFYGESFDTAGYLGVGGIQKASGISRNVCF